MEQPTFVYEALRQASSFLRSCGREERAAEWLLRHELNVDGAEFHLAMREKMSAESWERFKAMVERHAEGEPVQHITGVASFYGRDFQVNEHVLIPRPETEELVLNVLDRRVPKGKEGEPPLIVDVGTGSGIIAVTLALEWPGAKVTGIDLHDEALATARENASRHGAPAVFEAGDLLTTLRADGRKADIIISNPPYIPTEDLAALDDTVRDHEPHLALDGGASGLLIYEELAAQLPDVLAPDGLAAFEVGAGQSDDVAGLLQQALPNAHVSVRYDINGKDRMVFADLR
ncbi:release factor glutamine methyltransferase [Salsuginibacillus halophilus]|uniref:Release factor glutamine methyltransferase n=1 Tax=Salsuginibacillus halophilus TaxID=517424 RepID=A0A2P8HHW5_9BACI|nr:peptide chain release factor N(5)-glutamine methyltransferase [Salsuginibacillus halophilus]PSL45797.1 release factor glutamine methyltransferase [Salsuginibacillus halophilus]